MLVACARTAPPAGDVTPPPLASAPHDTAAPPAPEPVDPGATRAVNDRDFLPAALAAIEAAESRVRVAEFVMYDGAPIDSLLDALAAAVDRGVRVQVLADEEGDDTEAILYELGLHGVEAKLDSPSVTLHNKLIVADDVAIVGSHNWTWSALESNHEGSALVADPEVAAWYAGWFDAVWADPAGVPAVAPLERADLVPLADRSVVGAVLGCVEAAIERVDVVMYAITWDDRYPGSSVDRILTALEAAADRGVDVAVVVDASAWIVQNDINDAAVARLRAAGIPVWTAPPGRTTHAKVLRCDDAVLVGDSNWTYTGLDLVHGTSLLATHERLVADYAAWIEAVRGASTPVP